jgi:hypothetical protein
VLRRPQKNLVEKKSNNTVYKKTQNFMLVSKPLKKLQKSDTQKVIDKNVMEKCTFPTFSHVHQIGFLITFCVCIFLQLFQLFWNPHKILRFLISYLICINPKFFGGLNSTLSHFLLTLKLNPHRMAQKPKNALSK